MPETEPSTTPREIIIPLITFGEVHAHRLKEKIDMLRTSGDPDFELLGEVCIDGQDVWEAHVSGLLDLYSALGTNEAEAKAKARDRVRGLQASGRVAVGAVLQIPGDTGIDVGRTKKHLFTALQNTQTHERKPQIPALA